MEIGGASWTAGYLAGPGMYSLPGKETESMNTNAKTPSNVNMSSKHHQGSWVYFGLVVSCVQAHHFLMIHLLWFLLANRHFETIFAPEASKKSCDLTPLKQVIMETFREKPWLKWLSTSQIDAKSLPAKMTKRLLRMGISALTSGPNSPFQAHPTEPFLICRNPMYFENTSGMKPPQISRFKCRESRLQVEKMDFIIFSSV